MSGSSGLSGKRQFYAACTVLLCIPALLNRSPLLFPDTRAYYLGGQAAIQKLIGLLQRVASHASSVIPDSDTLVQQSRGVRSAYYSLLTYGLTKVATLWSVIILQSILTVWLISVVLTLWRPDLPRIRLLHVVAFLVLLTTLPWTVSVVLPDIFTPLTVLCLVCLSEFWQRLPNRQRACLLMLFGTSILMHITNLALAVALIIFGAATQRRGFRDRVAPWAAMTGVVSGAVLAMLFVGIVGFRVWSIAPNSPPFLLARSLEDGPGQLYLRDHCPASQFAMCRHLNQMDVSANAFIWGNDGLYSTVSPEERAALRRDDKRLFLLAAAEYPWMEAKAIVRNAAVQLFDFRVIAVLNSSAKVTNDTITLDLAGTSPPWLTVVSIVDYVIVLASCFWLGFLWTTGRLTTHERRTVLLIGTAVVLNAFAGAVSIPSPRYEARIIWLLPFMAVCFADRATHRYRGLRTQEASATHVRRD